MTLRTATAFAERFAVHELPLVAATPEALQGYGLIWHANYHPDGGQLFFPKQRAPSVVPLAPAGDDVSPGRFTAFYCDGSAGVYIHPGIWHEAVMPLETPAAFDDRQGRVHARVSCNFVREFGVYVAVPLGRPAGD